MTPTGRQREAIESWARGDVCVAAGTLYYWAQERRARR